MKSCPLGATSPQGGCFIVRKILPAASVWRVAWQGLEWAPTGQAFGGRPGRTLIGSEKAPQAQEGTDRWEPQERRRRARSAAQSQSSFEMQKGKWGGMASRVLGRRQGSDLIWTRGCHRSCSEQVLQSLRHYAASGPASGTHTKWACIIQAASRTARQSL